MPKWCSKLFLLTARGYLADLDKESLRCNVLFPLWSQGWNFVAITVAGAVEVFIQDVIVVCSSASVSELLLVLFLFSSVFTAAWGLSK